MSPLYFPTDSTTEMGDIAIAEVAKEGVLMKKFITDLGVVPGSEEPIPLYYNNNKAIAQAKEPRSHQKCYEEVLAY